MNRDRTAATSTYLYLVVLLGFTIAAGQAEDTTSGANNYTTDDSNLLGDYQGADLHYEEMGEHQHEELGEERARLTAYLPKPFALMSLICSYIMIREVLADQRAKRGGPIPRMLLSVAIADVFFSFAYFLGTWPAPPDSYYDVVGAMGNQAFCTFQGFLIQLGLVGAVLANAALSIYFLWVVRYGWADPDLAKWEKWIQGTIWVCALVSAIYPIPMELYNSNVEMCYIQSIPPECTGDCVRGSDPTIHHLVFATLPFVCLCVIMGVMVSLFVKVREIENKSKKYATSSNIPPPNNSLNTTDHSVFRASSVLSSSRPPIMEPVVDRKKSLAVARQAIFYALAFLMTYLFTLISTIQDHTTGNSNTVFDDIAYVAFFPSAGVFNFLVFSIPRTAMKTPEGRFLRATLCCSCFRSIKTSASSSSSSRETRACSQPAAVVKAEEETYNDEVEC